MYRFLPSLGFTALLILALYPDFGVDPRQPDAPARLPVLEIDDYFEPADDTPDLTDIHRIARGDSWIGETPCGEDIFAPPATLPGLSAGQAGPNLADSLIVKTGTDFQGRTTRDYQTAGGTTLRLVTPKISYYDLEGRTYADVRRDLQTRRPLNHITRDTQTDNVRQNDRLITVGYILSPSTLSYRYTRFGPQWKDGNYRLTPDSTVLISAHEIMLPRWPGYEDAKSRDRQKWDDFVCSTAHHELGHMRIHLDLLAETLSGYEALGSQTRNGLTTLVGDYRRQVGARIEARQAAYHVFNGGGTRRGRVELPYADLPLPWLEPKTDLSN